MSKYDRVYNFSAGPSMLPLEVIEKVAHDLPNYNGTGQSVMEMSHRSAEFQQIIYMIPGSAGRQSAVAQDFTYSIPQCAAGVK